jgi:hypothetical protein
MGKDISTKREIEKWLSANDLLRDRVAFAAPCRGLHSGAEADHLAAEYYKNKNTLTAQK